MIGATHFIEVWKGYSGKLYNEPVRHIRLLEDSLEFSKKVNYTTIAIWKIKAKC